MKKKIDTMSLWILLVLALALSGCRPASSEPRELATGHWFKPTSEPVISSPVAYDFDGNGSKEIAVGSWDGHLYLLDAQLNDLPGWPKYSPDGFFSSPALADLDGNGQPEIIAGSESGKLFAWHVDGSNATGFPVDLGYKLWASPTIVEGDHIAIGGKEQFFVLDPQGHTIAGWPQAIHGWPDATAAYAPGILVVSTLTPGDPSRGWLHAWSEEGVPLENSPLELSTDSDSSPALADLDGNGQWWIIFGDDAGWLHVVDRSGQPRTGFPVRTLGHVSGPTPTPHPPGGNIHSIEASPAIADIDRDGTPDIAVGSWDGHMYLWDRHGQHLPGWPVRVGDQIISSAALVDLNGDDQLDIIVGSKDGFLYGWTATAQPLPGFPYYLNAPVFSSPWVGDLEADDRADIVVGANNGIHVLQNVGALGRRTWPMFHRDMARSGAYQNEP
jgi:hypothetical protein